MNPLVVIPVYNEVTSLNKVLHELYKIYHGHVLLVDDGSTDGSIASIDSNIRKKIDLIQHSSNLGYGSAINHGFQYAITHRHDPIITMDCDEQHEPCRVPTFIERIIDSSADVVSGSRYLEDFTTNNLAPKDRANINSILTEKINQLFQWKLTDAFCGFKAYRLGIVEQLEVTETGYGQPLQVWIQLGFLKAKIEELAIPRIYQNLNRSFGVTLDNPEVRLKYYQEVIARELENVR